MQMKIVVAQPTVSSITVIGCDTTDSGCSAIGLFFFHFLTGKAVTVEFFFSSSMLVRGVFCHLIFCKSLTLIIREGNLACYHPP